MRRRLNAWVCPGIHQDPTKDFLFFFCNFFCNFSFVKARIY